MKKLGFAEVAALALVCLSPFSAVAQTPGDSFDLVRDGTPQAIEQAIRNGQKLGDVDKNGWTALMIAACFRNPEVITILLRGKADVNAQGTQDGMTALMGAAGLNLNSEVVGVLVAAGGDVKARDTHGMVALSYAARYNKHPNAGTMVNALLQAGADANSGNENGVTPFTFAAQENGNPDLIRALVNGGARVDEVERRAGVTALMYAARHTTNLAVATELLKAGANVNARNKTGGTALSMACEKNQSPGIVAALLEAGADVNSRDMAGWTPLICAAFGDTGPDTVLSLLGAGANARVVNAEGKTALDYAKGNLELKGTVAFKKLQAAFYGAAFSIDETSDNLIHARSGTCFPVSEGQYKRSVVGFLDEAGDHVAVGYSSSGSIRVELTEYIRPKYGTLDDYFNESKAAIVSNSKGIRLGMEDAASSAKQALFDGRRVFDGKEQVVMSFLLVQENLGWFIKIRATWPFPQQKLSSGEELMAFLNEMPLFLPGTQER